MATSSSVIYANPVVDNGTVYVATYSGKIYAYDTATSNLKWVYPSEGYVQGIIGGLAVYNGVIYFGSVGGTIFALDIATPAGYLEFTTRSYIVGGPFYRRRYVVYRPHWIKMLMLYCISCV
jgi:outer membrane protein assembly factor BamB